MQRMEAYERTYPVRQSVDAHIVRVLPSGQTQLFIGLHMIHEVTSPRHRHAARASLSVLMPERTVATVDHIVPPPTKRAHTRRAGRRNDGRHRNYQS